jgi:L-alanine-DL-glutamate epimerase-like enolase superfamily enzyme
VIERLIVNRVESIPLRIPLRVPFKISSGAARSSVEVVIVRLHTNEGIIGIGETQAWRRQGSSETLSSLTTLIEQHIAPHVIGRSPFDLSAIMYAIDEAVWHGNYPKAAVADALLDLQGKALGLPVYQLLGGKSRDGVAACAILPIHPEIKKSVEEAERFFDRGFRSFTIKVGTSVSSDTKLVRAMRERFGGNVILRVDANASMNFDDALSLLKKIEPYDIDAAEQLISLWDIDGMAELARRSSIPMMADESVSDEHALISVIKKRAATSIQTKIAKNGGIFGCRKLWTIAAAAGLRIYPGNHPSTSIATLAKAHLATSWAGPLLDGPFAVGVTDVIAEDIVQTPVVLDGRMVRVADVPGFGVELDDDRIKHLRADR